MSRFETTFPALPDGMYKVPTAILPIVQHLLTQQHPTRAPSYMNLATFENNF